MRKCVYVSKHVDGRVIMRVWVGMGECGYGEEEGGGGSFVLSQ